MVTKIHPVIADRIQIIPPSDSPKRVSFSDLNPIRSFHFNEPPILIREKNELSRLRAHIKILESQIERYESLPPTPSQRSAASSVSSFGLSSIESNPIDAWLRHNAPPPANVQRAVAARPVAPPPVQQPAQRPAVRVPQPKPISKTRKFFAKVALGISIIGALGIVPSIAACFIMLPMGLVGLTLSVGCAILGATIHASLISND